MNKKFGLFFASSHLKKLFTKLQLTFTKGQQIGEDSGIDVIIALRRYSTINTERHVLGLI